MVIALNEGVKCEAMKAYRCLQYIITGTGQPQLLVAIGKGKGEWVKASFKDGCWQGMGGFGKCGQLTPLTKSWIFQISRFPSIFEQP